MIESASGAGIRKTHSGVRCMHDGRMHCTRPTIFGNTLIELERHKEYRVSLSAILVSNDGYSPSWGTVGLGHNQPRTPLACVDIFGRSIIDRTATRYRELGTSAIAVVTSSTSFRSAKGVDMAVALTRNDRWMSTRTALQRHFQRGIRTALIAELGAYVEFDLIEALSFHRAKRQPVTPLHDAHGFLGYAFVEIISALSDKSFAFPLDSNAVSENCVPYVVRGYVNRLPNAKALRRLVIDSFLGRCSIAPQGKQLKPGVWVDVGARVHRLTRLVAPAYVGRNTQVQAAAVVSSFSNLERNCRVGRGSVVSNASVLPDTLIGAGLDIAAAVVDGNEFMDLNRNVCVEIEDPNLIASAAPGKSRLVNAPQPVDPSDLVVPPQIEPDYSQYLSRTASRVFEVFRGEV